MAIVTKRSVYNGQIVIEQFGDGVPSHTVSNLTIYTDTLTAIKYKNVGGGNTWTLDDQSTTYTYNTTDINLTANVTASDGDLATNTPIANIPASRVKVKVGGLEVNVGSGEECYFADVNTPFTVRNSGEEEQGDLLYWNGSVAGYELDANDEIDFEYLIEA